MIGLDQLGARLAKGRQAHRLSQRELARRLGVSPSLISQIENGKVQPSVATLMAVVNELGLSIDEVLHVGDSVAEPISERASAGAPSGDDRHPPSGSAPNGSGGRGAVVQLGTNRPIIELSSGVTWERLTVKSDAEVDFILVTYPPGATSSEGDQLLTHAGTEYWYVMSGVLTVRLVFDEYRARAERLVLIRLQPAAPVPK